MGHGRVELPRSARLADLGRGGLLQRAMARLTLAMALGSYWLLASGVCSQAGTAGSAPCRRWMASSVGGELRISPSSGAARSWLPDACRCRLARRAPASSWSRLASSQRVRKRSSAAMHRAAVQHLLRARARQVASRTHHQRTRSAGASTAGVWGTRSGRGQVKRLRFEASEPA
jgi:hypothetical protein